MLEFSLAVAASAISFGLGYYLGHRGLAGIKSDLNDVKADVEKIKNAPSVTIIPTP